MHHRRGYPDAAGRLHETDAEVCESRKWAIDVRR